jgi:phytoene synthase
MDTLKKAYRHCENIMAEHSKTFHKAFSFLPAEQKKAVWAVYAFCRKVDDIVDEGTNPEKELQQFEQEFEQFKQGVLMTHDDMWLALGDVFQRFDMNIEAFDDMIQGQRMDLTKMEYMSLEEVKRYSYHVASTVGLMLLPILAPKTHHQLKEQAIALGIAMQITNILRDVGEDLDRGRIYLPRDYMVKHGYTVEMLESKMVNSAFTALWESLAEEAERLYEKGLESLELYPVASRLPLKGAAHLYRAILASVRKKGYNVFQAKHFVTIEEKQRILEEIS